MRGSRGRVVLPNVSLACCGTGGIRGRGAGGAGGAGEAGGAGRAGGKGEDEKKKKRGSSGLPAVGTPGMARGVEDESMATIAQ